MHFLSPSLENYIAEHSQKEPSLLSELTRETHLKVVRPRMITGHHQGRVLSLLSKLIRPKHILEIGTYTGYAALCLAEGLQPNGKLITLEANAELGGRIRAYFDQSEHKEQIELRIGNAVDVIPSLTETWDLVFIDADKGNYSTYFDLVIDQLNTGGIIIADNVLWSGKISDPSKNDPATKSLREFNAKVHADSRVQNVLFPIRDGLMILRKL